MNEKKFDEIMQDFVNSTTSSREQDFSKRKEVVASITKPKKIPFWIALTTVLTAVIVLAIVLPITLTKGGSETPVIYQITIDDFYMLSNIQLSDIDEIDNIILPKIATRYDNITVWKLKSNDSFLGIETHISVYDDYIENVKIKAWKREYEISLYDKYYEYKDSSEWRDKQVKYNIEADDSELYFNYHIYFIMNDYRYCIDVLAYEEIPINELLDIIY